MGRFLAAHLHTQASYGAWACLIFLQIRTTDLAGNNNTQGPLREVWATLDLLN